MTEGSTAEANLDRGSDDVLRALLAFALTNPILFMRSEGTRKLVPLRKEAALQERPDLVREAYAAVARITSTAGCPPVSASGFRC